ncbi:MAG TPA: hypothetical protein VML94_01260 [Thermoplasmata archaeon]|nr:hypothetical protein [Thermoplasmata archaeon]
MSVPPSNPPFPTGFVVATFVVSVAIGAAIILYGIQGHLGWGVP